MKADQDLVQIWMEPNGWQMQIMGKGDPHPPGHYDKIVVQPGDTDNVTFQIVKTPHASFATNAPFCAQANAPKPTACDPVFTHVTVVGQKLTVLDTNPVKQDYNYVLNFTNYPQLDPIFNNGGNGKGASTSILLLATALLLAVVVGLFFAWRGGPAPSGGSANSKSSRPSNGDDAGPI